MQVNATKRQIETLIKPELAALNQQLVQRHQAEAAKVKNAKPPLTWNLTLTPLLPVAWPPNGSSQLVVYAVGSTQIPGQGTYVSAPFARAIVDAKGRTPPKVEWLEKPPRSLGSQAVRPAENDPNLMKRAESLENQVAEYSGRTAPPTVGTNDIKRLYGVWRAQNSVIADLLRDQHSSFFEWLDQP